MLHCHVAITLEWFVLKWFWFSGEGLLFSKDSAGAVRMSGFCITGPKI
jgi:hypothetical protein